MDGVDRSDQYRERGAGFASKAHYKMWYKKAFFAILDFMVLNSFFTLNMSAEEIEDWLHVKRSDYYAALVEELMAYVDNTGGKNTVLEDLASVPVTNDHNPVPASHKERMQCAVCNLEEKWMDASKMKQDYGSGSRQQRHLVVCTSCGISAHSHPVSWPRNIFKMNELKQMSCFQIIHSEHCMGLWIGKGGQSNMTIGQGKAVKKQAYSESIAHPLYRTLMETYGLTPRPRNAKKRRGGSAGSRLP